MKKTSQNLKKSWTASFLTNAFLNFTFAHFYTGEEIGNSRIDIQTIPSKRELSGIESFVVFDLETTGTSYIIFMS
jgi:hypothetical protein